MPLRVSAIQLTFAYAYSPQEFFDRMRGEIECATASASEDGTLVVLPALTGWQLLGITVPDAQEKLALDEIARLGGFRDALHMLTNIAPTMRDFYVHLFASIAQRCRVYLAPGTVIELDDAKLYNTAYLFAPDGRIVGTQRQTHRSAQEMNWGLARGDELNVFDIGTARVGFVISTDIEYPEVSRILALQNANLLIHPAAYTTWQRQHFLLDLWREVQSNQVFGVQACMVGKHFKGRSAIYVPIDATPARQGILVQTPSSSADGSISAILDFDVLQKAVEAFPIFDFFNYEFYTRQFPGVYLGKSK